MRILLINCCYTSNFGDQAIGDSIKKSLDKTGHYVEQYDLYNIDSKKQLHIYSTNNVVPNYYINRRKTNVLKKIINMIRWRIKNRKLLINICKKRFDLLIIGGGELIQSNVVFPFTLSAWTKTFKNNNRLSKICFFSIGVTAKYSFLDKHLLRKAINLGDYVYVRDNASQLNLKNEFNRESTIVPDSVIGSYRLKNTPKNGKYILYGITSFERISKYGFMNIKSKEDYFEYVYSSLNDFNNDNICLFYSDISDKKECYIFNDYVKQKYKKEYKIASTNSLDDFDLLISKCSNLISPRMHPCIFSLLYNKETHPVLISDKMKSFKELYLHNKFERSIYEFCYDERINELLTRVKQYD